MTQNNSKLCSISATQFYRNGDVKGTVDGVKKRDYSSRWLCFGSQQLSQHSSNPTQDWSAFYKQADALDFAESQNSSTTTLLTFVYEKTDGRRIFLVAHPIVYWWHFNEIHPEKRCAYEVIPQGAACCVYLDLEYHYDLNQNSNGPRMTKTIIEIICAYMKKYWGIICDERNVLNLDSTTTTKFSRHVIFRIKNVAFKDNIHVGRFIKNICHEIYEYLATNGSAYHDILSHFDRESIEELIVETAKKKKIFIDTGVYTKNRHFRIFKATKLGKSSHLVLAPENKYIPLNEMANKELGIFLESLVSYFPHKSELIFLEVNDNSVDTRKYTQPSQRSQHQRNCDDQIKDSSYPAIDKFISDLVYPGTIRLATYFVQTQTIVYEISGNRFCANIGRPHKSNGIYWVVDLRRLCAYQKCHDQEDCANFKSEVTPLPCELSFLLDEADDDLFFNISDTLENSTESTNPDTS